MTEMPLILLAPSEEKAPGGAPGRLSETPTQRGVREQLVAAARAGEPAVLQKLFQVKGAALEQAQRETLQLGTRVPLLPALERYAGVAFQALDAATLPRASWTQVFILSSLRGLVRGDGLLPPYKLKLGSLPGLKARWRAALPLDLAALPPGPLWELLPGEVAGLLQGWTRPRHRVEILDPSGRSISHFSKKYRGLVARWILAHQQGDPARVKRAALPGCHWGAIEDNETGGRTLALVVEP